MDNNSVSNEESRQGVRTTKAASRKDSDVTTTRSTAIQHNQTDRRCRYCGDCRDTGYRRITELHYEWMCWDSFACTARQNAEAAWAAEHIDGPAGIAALRGAMRLAVAS